MKGLISAAIAIGACGGQTATIVDAGSDAPAVACWGEARTNESRTCQGTGDCAVLDHVADCCGSIVVEGVRGDQVDAVHNVEIAANAGCAQCKCVAKPTVDESGNSGGAYLASCENGLCTAHAQ